MVWEGEEGEELLGGLIEALPRLRQYRLSEAQRVFIEKLEEMKRRVAEGQVRQLNLAKN